MFVNAESSHLMPIIKTDVIRLAHRAARDGHRPATLMNAGNQMSTSTMQASTREQITEVVQRILADRGITRSFGAQEDLREVGLTSLDMVNLVLAVEAALAVGIPEAEITPANFRSVATIEALVVGLRHRSAA
jgi:acyl carrier protein